MSNKLFWNIVGYTAALLAAFSIVALLIFTVIIFTAHQFVYLGFITAIIVLVFSVIVLHRAARKTKQPWADFFLDLFFWV